jgi:mRNA-degrading endonuclease RelE of RelBE toxin-antitoxin system
VSSDYKLIYHKDAIKFIAKQERVIQERISKALTGLAIRPPIGDIKLLKGQGRIMRLRIGSYRVIFEVNNTEQIVLVLTIDNRGDVY